MKERVFESGNYRYGFNSQEKDDEVAGSGNINTAEYWEYDCRLGRRWNLVPFVKEFSSPYLAMGDNPIWLVDKNGGDTSFADNNTRQQFNSTYNTINSEIKYLDKKIANKMEKWKKKGYENNVRNKRMIRQIGKLNTKRSELKEIKSSFDDVINSKLMFFYTADPNPNRSFTSGGSSHYDVAKNRMEVHFYSGLTGTIVHETRHCSGFLQGEWGINWVSGNMINYSYQDEFVAYQMESSYHYYFMNGGGRSNQEIMSVIKLMYSRTTYIQKNFNQVYVPYSPCQK